MTRLKTTEEKNDVTICDDAMNEQRRRRMKIVSAEKSSLREDRSQRRGERVPNYIINLTSGKTEQQQTHCVLYTRAHIL